MTASMAAYVMLDFIGSVVKEHAGALPLSISIAMGIQLWHDGRNEALWKAKFL